MLFKLLDRMLLVFIVIESSFIYFVYLVNIVFFADIVFDSRGKAPSSSHFGQGWLFPSLFYFLYFNKIRQGVVLFPKKKEFS